MKLDFNVSAKMFDGSDFTIMKNGKPEPATYAQVIVNFLSGAYPDEQSLSGVEKYERGRIAKKLMGEGEKNYTTEECAVIKDVVGRYGIPQLIYQVYQFIDPKDDV